MWVAATLGVGGGVRPALAQPPPPASAQADERGRGQDEDRRAALYRAGVDAAAAGRWAEAREDFQGALTLRASPRVFFSLAQCEERLGQLASAEADYARAERWAREASGDTDVVSAAEQAERALGPRVPHVRVLVAGADGDPGGSSATLDGAATATGTPVAVDPGVHRIVVRAPGMREVSVTAAVGEGQQLDVPLRLEAEAATRPAPAVRAAEGEPLQAAGTAVAGPWRAVGVAAGAAGIVALGVGAAFGAVAKSKNDQSYAIGCHGDDCTPPAAAVRRDAISAANASTALVVAGSLLAASGIALWVLAPAGTKTARVGVAPMAALSGGGVAVEGAW
jgi:hypothetical protein